MPTTRVTRLVGLATAVRRRVVAVLLAAVMTGPGLTACREVGPRSGSPDAVECAALGALLDTLDPRNGPAVLLDSTAGAPWRTPAAAAHAYAVLRRALPTLAPSTWASYVARNARPSAGCPPRPTRRRLVLQPGRRRDLDAFVLEGQSLTLPDGRDRFWTAFQARYPGARGFLDASRVGVGAEDRQALLWLEYSCAGLCGRSAYVLLERGPFGPFSRWVPVAGALGMVH
ncbi:MAG TPA: hypothetical protein VGD56_00740 [Gemmatirosa sp.]